MNPSVFVVGATGEQGSALARQLREIKWNVRTTVRDLNSPKAVALANAGVHLTQGDWDDIEALKSSLAGCDKLWLCVFTDIEDLDHVLLQARNIVRIAKDADVKQVVSSTSLGVFVYEDKRLKPGSPLHMLQSVQKGIEDTVSAGGFESFTFLRPAFFMTNFIEPFINLFSELLEQSTWTTVLRPETRLGLVDVENIAQIGVAAFQDPGRFKGRAIGLAGELLTPQDVMEQLGERMGRPFQALFMSDEEVAADDGLRFIIKGDPSMRYTPEYINLEELGSVARLTTFRDFLERERARIKKI
ncbi:NmrA family protein [Hypoxylon cercidicola]|nr:NmrA family protein [Hypoxylon cercidicola]